MRRMIMGAVLLVASMPVIGHPARSHDGRERGLSSMKVAHPFDICHISHLCLDTSI